MQIAVYLLSEIIFILTQIIFESMEIQEIKQHLTMSAVLQKYNLKPDKNHRLCCPFHEDNTPSMQVYYKTQTCILLYFQLPHAWQKLRCDRLYNEERKHYQARSHIKSTGFYWFTNRTKPKPQPKPEPKPELPQKQKIAILTEAFKHFARSLNAKPEKAIQYLATRKLDYKKLAIGYDTGTQHKTKEITAEQKQLYLQTSLIKPDKFDRENHCSYCKSRNKKPYYAKRNTHT